MKKYKYITIRQEHGEMFENKPVYRIFNNGILTLIKIKPSHINNETTTYVVTDYYKTWKGLVKP